MIDYILSILSSNLSILISLRISTILFIFLVFELINKIILNNSLSFWIIMLLSFVISFIFIDINVYL